MIFYISFCCAMGLTAMSVYLYFWKKGQFDDVEDIKYQVFRDDERTKD